MVIRNCASSPYLHAQVNARSRLNDDSAGLSELEALARFEDMVGRVAPLTDTKLGLVGAIQHLHLLPTFRNISKMLVLMSLFQLVERDFHSWTGSGFKFSR